MKYLEEEDKIALTTQEAISFSLLRYTGFGAEEAYPCRRLNAAERRSLGLGEGVLLERSFEEGEHRFVMAGEADGCEAEGRTVVLRVFFAVDADPEAPGEKTLKVCRGEAYLLAAMAARRGSSNRLEINLYEPSTGRLSRRTETPTAHALDRFFARSAAAVALYAAPEIIRVRVRLPAMRRLAFPYPDVREGQEELMKAVYHALSAGGRLYACAPTGTGKTVSTLYPALRAMGQGKCEKVFYLTGKATAARMAADTAALLGRTGALRAILLASKERLCPEHGIPCRNGGICPLRKTPEGRLEEAALDLCAQAGPVVTPEKIARAAEERRVCPHELSLRVSFFCDLIICDYNYLFDPVVRLERYFSLPGKWGFLIDEAHNLADRVRDMYSEELTDAELSAQAALLPPPIDRPDAYAAALAETAAYFSAVLGPLAGEEKSRADGEGGSIRRTLPEELPEYLTRLYTAAERRARLKDERLPQESRVQIRIFSYKLKTILYILSCYDPGFRLLVGKRKKGVFFRTLCPDPSGIIGRALSFGRGAVLFSATLLPLPFYRDLLGGDASSRMLELPSPFERDNLAIAVMDKLSTRYADREESLSAVLSAIRTTVTARPGNYMVFCPSFAYLDALAPLLPPLCPGMKILRQERRMDAEARTAFLREFREDSTVLGLCVLGGIYGEGVDLSGRRLIGAVVIGVGLPGPDLLREETARYFSEKSENGMEYAYIYPGMNRVLQAAGRVIRSEEDRGVVVLIDDRFATPVYRGIFPAHWRGLTYVGDERSLREYLRRFWNGDR